MPPPPLPQPVPPPVLSYGHGKLPAKDNAIKFLCLFVIGFFSLVLVCGVGLYVSEQRNAGPSYLNVASVEHPSGKQFVSWMQVREFMGARNTYALVFHGGPSGFAPVFTVTAEKPDDGQTQVLWSNDGKQIIVVANGFHTKPGNTVHLVDGRAVIVWMDIAGGGIKTSATEHPATPAITVDDLISFPVKLR